MDDLCDHCHHDPEDVLHALWQYPHLDPVWNSNPCWNFWAASQFSRFVDLVQFVIKENMSLELFAQVTWTIWHRKNLLRISTRKFPVEHILPEALGAFLAFIRAIPPKPPDCVTRVPQQIKWKPPAPTCFKVNFDGAVFREDNMAGVGVIIRDELGQTIAPWQKKSPSQILLLHLKHWQRSRLSIWLLT